MDNNMFTHLKPDYIEEVITTYGGRLKGFELDEDDTLILCVLLNNAHNAIQAADGLDLSDEDVTNTVTTYLGCKCRKFCGVQPMNLGPVSFAFLLRLMDADESSERFSYTVTFDGVKHKLEEVQRYLPWKLEEEDGDLDTIIHRTYYELAARVEHPDDYMLMNVDRLIEDDDDFKTKYIEPVDSDKPELVIPQDMPLTTFSLERGVVEALSRRTYEGEDLSTHIDDYVVRAILASAFELNVMGHNVVHKLWEGEELRTRLLLASSEISIATRRARGNMLVVNATTIDRVTDAVTGIKGVNVIEVDSDALDNRVLMTYRGSSHYDAGVAWCPYVLWSPTVMTPGGLESCSIQDIVLRDMRVRKETVSKTRFGLLQNLVGTEAFLRVIEL